jgi:hypothetical protein
MEALARLKDVDDHLLVCIRWEAFSFFSFVMTMLANCRYSSLVYFALEDAWLSISMQ